MLLSGNKKRASPPPEVLSHAERLCTLARSNFVKCFGLMTRRQREAMTLFYAFCREVDDWADEEELGSPASRLSVLSSMKEDLRGGTATASRSHWEVIVGVGFLMEQYKISPKPFIDLIDGMMMDCHYQPFRLWDDTLQYCYKVASTVGIVSVHIFCRHPERVMEYAVAQGMALQLVNIYRDFQEDLTRRRCYLPLEWLNTNLGQMQEFLSLGLVDQRKHPLYAATSRAREALRFEARKQMRRAWRQLPLREAPAVWPLLVMGLMYVGILDKIPVGSFDRPSVKPLDFLRQSLPLLFRL